MLIEMTGPFSSEEMHQWFSAGYFTMDLMVKRTCDADFQTLGKKHCSVFKLLPLILTVFLIIDFNNVQIFSY